VFLLLLIYMRLHWLIPITSSNLLALALENIDILLIYDMIVVVGLIFSVISNTLSTVYASILKLL